MQDIANACEIHKASVYLHSDIAVEGSATS